MVKARESLSSAIEDAISDLAEDRRLVKIEDSFAVGVDIGRTRDATEIYVLGISPTGIHPLRLAITLEKMPFVDQELVVASVLSKLPIQKMLIDRSGIGRNLAENIEGRFGSRVEGVDFTASSKTMWATDAKLLFQHKKLILPVDRDMAYQIHSIKKMITGAKNLVFDTSANEKHHADKFWALALALSAANANKMRGKKTAGVL
jgi:phage FluMu gp28-like protein